MSREADARDDLSALIDLERSQIGHDIHDLLLPLIFAADAGVQAVLRRADENSEDHAKLAEVHRWLGEAQSVGRGLLTEIYPPELDQVGWLAAAKDAVRRISGETCEVVWSVTPDTPLCTPDLDRALASATYRVVLQAVRNAIQHGPPETIAVRAGNDKLEIVDDGPGFEPADVPSDRFGLRSMKGRAALVGKRVEIHSEPGGPTNVTFWL